LHFGGKEKSADLDYNDVQNLANGGWRFVRWANAQYIVRNMGGDVIKCDRWLTCFLTHFGIRGEDLETQLRVLGISAALFDVTIWAYCEEHVRMTRNFHSHFAKHFGNMPSANARKQ
jgi:hypothetical protein